MEIQKSVCHWCKNRSFSDSELSNRKLPMPYERKMLYAKHLFFGIHELEKIPEEIKRILDQIVNGDEPLFQEIVSG